MQSRVRNAGPWEMKHLKTTLVSSWNLAGLDLGDDGTVSQSKQNASLFGA